MPWSGLENMMLQSIRRGEIHQNFLLGPRICAVGLSYNSHQQHTRGETEGQTSAGTKVTAQVMEDYITAGLHCFSCIVCQFADVIQGVGYYL